MCYWIIFCSLRKYDLIGAFLHLKRLNWRQSTNIAVGDIVYIYTGDPYHSITHKCRVLEVNLKTSYIDDSKYVKSKKRLPKCDRYMTFEFITALMIGIDWLNSHNIPGIISKPRRISNEIDKEYYHKWWLCNRL